jgi:hypothetical protein
MPKVGNKKFPYTAKGKKLPLKRLLTRWVKRWNLKSMKAKETKMGMKKGMKKMGKKK